MNKNNERLLDFSYKAWENKDKIKEKTLTKTSQSREYSKKYNVMYREEKINTKKYYWLNANPKIWIFSELKNGEIIEYTAVNENGNKRRIYRNYQNAKKGDMVIAYESTPIKAIVGICMVEEKLKDNIYQIFTYVKNKDNTGNVSGMLLYAKTDENIWTNQTNTFGKNSITITTLDLTQNFEIVKKTVR